jgi:hypothetical protein
LSQGEVLEQDVVTALQQVQRCLEARHNENEHALKKMMGETSKSITWSAMRFSLPTPLSNIAAGFTARFQSQEFFFSNATLYRNYRWRAEATRIMPNHCCMQVAEVWRLTTSAPPNQAPSTAPAGLRR